MVAAICNKNKTTGIRAIIHALDSFVMAAPSKKIVSAFCPKEAEARALSTSLLWARDVGLNLHTVESNA